MVKKVEECTNRALNQLKEMRAEDPSCDLRGYESLLRATLLWEPVLKVINECGEYDKEVGDQLLVCLNEVEKELARRGIAVCDKAVLTTCLIELKRVKWIETGDFYFNGELTVFLKVTESGLKALNRLGEGEVPELGTKVG